MTTLRPLLLLAVLLVGCVDEPTAPPAPATDGPTPDALARGGLVLDQNAPPAPALLSMARSATRTELGGGVVHYAFEVPVDRGPYGKVRLHRVVRERRPGVPVRTDGTVFMTHGASLDFAAIFLRAGTAAPSPATSVALYLADRDIDVWGMDFAWTLVPAETTDFSFMADWGIDRDIGHTLAAMSVARLLRGLSGQGFAPMNLLGFSYGAAVSYGAAARETRMPRVFRDVGGIVPVDLALKYPDPSSAAVFGDPCVEAGGLRDLMSSGDYVNPGGLVLETLPPPVAFFIGARTYLTDDREYWHFVSGADNPDGSIRLLDTDPERWLRFLTELPPYMPRRATYDRAVAACPELEDVAWDDDLGAIAVPVLYLGAGGAFGTAGEYTAGLTASDDATALTASIAGRTPETDYGHADLFMAGSAPELVWGPLADWLVDHAARGRR